jgi:hypothetical protein
MPPEDQAPRPKRDRRPIVDAAGQPATGQPATGQPATRAGMRS